MDNMKIALQQEIACEAMGKEEWMTRAYNLNNATHILKLEMSFLQDRFNLEEINHNQAKNDLD